VGENEEQMLFEENGFTESERKNLPEGYGERAERAASS